MSHGLQRARRTAGGKGEGSITGGERVGASRSETDEGRQRLPRWAEAERWSFDEDADDGLKKSSAIASGIYVQGYPARLGLARCRR